MSGISGEVVGMESERVGRCYEEVGHGRGLLFSIPQTSCTASRLTPEAALAWCLTPEP